MEDFEPLFCFKLPIDGVKLIKECEQLLKTDEEFRKQFSVNLLFWQSNANSVDEWLKYDWILERFREWGCGKVHSVSVPSYVNIKPGPYFYSRNGLFRPSMKTLRRPLS